jgi:NADH-quinone oxidoreductase subunit G
MAEMVTVTIDGTMVQVPKGTLAIRAAEAAGIAIPRFCDHPLLDPAGACRQCMIEIVDFGNGRGFPRPQPACTTETAEGMVLNTQETSNAAAKAQADILELLLINHPLDCPVCDKGGECPLQNQAMAQGRCETRFEGTKRHFPKPIPLSELLLLDRERCVMCTRCTRFADQISGDPMISLVERGAKQQVGIYPEEPYDSYFSGNAVQICPVGALTSSDYRFSARPFDLVSTVSTCENCAAGCEIRVDARRGEVKRRNAGENPEVNEEWTCDRGRFGFVSNRGEDRITKPMIRKGKKWEPISWPEALSIAVKALRKANDRVGVLTSGRLTLETAYTYSKFARTVLKTNSIDFRARPSSSEEADFLATQVAGRKDSITYADLEKAKKVILVAFEPEDESPMVFLRLRKAVRKKGLQVETLAPFMSRGSQKLGATLTLTAPSELPKAIEASEADADTIILVGEVLAQIPGGLTAVVDKVEASSAKMVWIPRRAGEIGAIEAGCLPGLLPGGHPVSDTTAVKDLEALWGTELPTTQGLDASELLKKAAQGDLKVLITAGIEAGDFRDSQEVIDALENTFVISFESRMSDVTKYAKVVFPVALLEETEGTFLNWEYRAGIVRQAINQQRTPLTEIRILAALAEALGSNLGFRTPMGAADSLAEIPIWGGAKPTPDKVKATEVPTLDKGQLVVSTWRELLDDSRCLDGADSLRATSRPIAAKVSVGTAKDAGLEDATTVRIASEKGSLILPLVLDPTMVDGVIWVPTRAKGHALSSIGVGLGSTVAVDSPDSKEGEK